jgi:organic radical activating enzyme
MSSFVNIPFERIVESRDVQLHYNNIFQIHWILGRFCNYNCSYCWPDSHSLEKDEEKDVSYFTGAIDKIIEQGKKNGFDSFHLALSGGEPTLQPHMLAVVEQFGKYKTPDNSLTLVVVTNLSRSFKWFDSFIAACKNMTYVTVVASWHREFAKRDQFASRVKYLMERGINVSVNITFSVDLFDEYYDDAMYLKEQGLIVKALPQRTTNKKDYTQQQLDILQQSFSMSGIKRPAPINPYPSTYVRPTDVHTSGFSMELIDDVGEKHYVDYPERFPSVGFTNFEGWTCYSGYQNICIDEFGNLRRGKAGCKDVVIGNIFKDGPYVYDTPQPCPKRKCDAATDSITRKIRVDFTKRINTLRKEIPIYPVN